MSDIPQIFTKLQPIKISRWQKFILIYFISNFILILNLVEILEQFFYFKTWHKLACTEKLKLINNSPKRSLQRKMDSRQRVHRIEKKTASVKLFFPTNHNFFLWVQVNRKASFSGDCTRAYSAAKFVADRWTCAPNFFFYSAIQRGKSQSKIASWKNKVPN